MNEKKCKLCGKIFVVRAPNELRTRVYCSKQCQIESQKVNKVTSQCEQCGEKFDTVPSHARRYCSIKCKGLASRKTKDPGFRNCIKCKKTIPISDFSSAGKNKTGYICKACCRRRTKERLRTPRGRLTASKAIARRRNMEWSISEEWYYNLLRQKCHYCYDELNPTGTGLDRVDNNKGYTEENVVPCCSSCNTTRSDNFSYNEMLLLAVTIRDIKARRNNA